MPTKTRKPILLLGATDYASVFMDTFEAIPGVRFSGCVQNLDPDFSTRKILEKEVYWSDEIFEFKCSHELICILATTLRKKWIQDLESKDFHFTSLVHPFSCLSKRGEIGRGVSVDAGAIIASFSQIGDHVRIGRRVSIGHHTKIGPFSTVHPGAVVSGHCVIGEQVIIGAGAVIIDHVDIGDGAFIGAGSVVNKSVPARALVAGNPARIASAVYGPK